LVAAALGVAAVFLHGCGKSEKPETKLKPFNFDALKRKGEDYTMTCAGPWGDWGAWEKNATVDGVKIVLATTAQELADTWAEALPEPFKDREVVVDEDKIEATAAVNPKALGDAMAALGEALEKKAGDLKKARAPLTQPLRFSLDALKREGEGYTLTCEGPWGDWAAWKKDATLHGVKIVLATTVQALADTWEAALPEPFKDHKVKVVDAGKKKATATLSPTALGGAMAALGDALEKKAEALKEAQTVALLELPDPAPVSAGRRRAGGQGFLAASG